MAMYIAADDCVSCGDCATECPTGSIHEGRIAYEIDAATCTECEDEAAGPRCVEACSVSGCIAPLAS